MKDGMKEWKREIESYTYEYLSIIWMLNFMFTLLVSTNALNFSFLFCSLMLKVWQSTYSKEIMFQLEEEMLRREERELWTSEATLEKMLREIVNDPGQI